MLDVDCVDFCRALGDTTRQALLKLLQQEGEQCVGCLVDRFGLAQPTISHHLLLLKRAGLVKSHKAGKQVFYAIDQDNVVECCGMLLATFTTPSAQKVGLPIAEAAPAVSGEATPKQPAAKPVSLPITVASPVAAPEAAFAGERDTK
jgi:ArsR family transcriptional regulator, arsenate/arsenite/antimonite-responsive transcriptional repressor